MKIRSRVRLIVIIVVIVAALVGLYTVYSRQAAERNDLTERLESAQALAPVLTAQKNELENELAQAQSLLHASEAEFPQAVESIEYGEDLFKVASDGLFVMAGECDVDLTRLIASPPAARTVGSVTYSVSSFTVVVEGEIGKVLNFIDAIGTGLDYKLRWSFQLPWSVDVKSVNMVVGGSATISLDIYGYAR